MFMPEHAQTLPRVGHAAMLGVNAGLERSVGAGSLLVEVAQTLEDVVGRGLLVRLLRFPEIAVTEVRRISAAGGAPDDTRSVAPAAAADRETAVLVAAGGIGDRTLRVFAATRRAE